MRNDPLMDITAAWNSALAYQDRCTPVAFDKERGLLLVECLNHGWAIQVRLLVPHIAKRVNAALPAPVIKVIGICVRKVRVLVTGSRRWTLRQELHEALFDAWHDAIQCFSDTTPLVIVHGDCPTGADAMAKQWAIDNGIPHEPHPADWAAPCPESCARLQHRKTSPQHGEYCPLAGYRRNQQMVDLGADLVLAFQRQNSPGTAHCIRRAEAAGIPVRRIEDPYDPVNVQSPF